MRPRVVLLADELLSGHAREHVQARIERFINHHIATVLKPLDDLTRAEDLQGIAKGLAYQIAENLGVLFRRDITEEVKALDQEGRASMRKYGIRFGAYHVFMPALLKPAPAELITLLWALKNDALDKPGYGDLIPALAAGRTSIVTDTPSSAISTDWPDFGSSASAPCVSISSSASPISSVRSCNGSRVLRTVPTGPMTAAVSSQRLPCSPSSAPPPTIWRKSSRASVIALTA